MSIVSCIPEQCKRCYVCVRECPAKAIKVEKGQAIVIEDRCIACGNCVKVCTQHAKRVQDNTADVRALLDAPGRVIACMAPSFPAAFDTVPPARVIAAMKQIGFDEVWAVAFGAELVSREYRALFRETARTGKSVIASPCPAVVAYVEKYMPDIRDSLAPIVSPMIATARAIRRRHAGEDVSVVFIGPCIAKKNEILDPLIADTVNFVLTFKEISSMFEAAKVDFDSLEDAEIDGPRCGVGWSFPLSSGLLKTAGVKHDLLDTSILTTEGKDRALDVLDELAQGASQAKFLDVLFCEGCISGPKMLNDLGVHARKEILANYVKEQAWRVGPEEMDQWQNEFQDLDLKRGFSPQNAVLPDPTEEQITRTLQEMRKFSVEDQLNCGACGYPTCREKAIAVCQGLAEKSMCLPYLLEELENTCRQLQESHQELADAHQRLVQTERLASMGELSAGVAHEINNPLGTVLLYSHMLLRRIRDEESKKDLEMIASEATRCKNIVRGLLDFTRQSHVTKVPTDMSGLIDDIFAIMKPRAEAAGVALSCGVVPGMPVIAADPDQIKQVIVNLVRNGIEAIGHDHGEVRITARPLGNGESVEIKVSDNGSGIPKENISRLFTPFFTTKEMGKGTGLGLAIAYGIVKMHYGDINVSSEEGKGTTFTLSLPVGHCDDGAEAP
ncbi:MAG: 4Fe-4S binding protein [Candidatus Hydrogenedentes bacterium]|nr:4Fe-4S binding protein [Candidatus Hydrogenedentota bacterium]